MALVACRECGHRVSDGAKTCPSCGLESPGGVTQLEIKRVPQLVGSMVPMSVWIDSNHVGTLTSGKSLMLTVAPGVHRVECGLQKAGTKDGSQEFDVPAGQRLVIVVATSKWNGKPSFSAELA